MRAPAVSPSFRHASAAGEETDGEESVALRLEDHPRLLQVIRRLAWIWYIHPGLRVGVGAVQDVDMYILKCISQYGDNQVGNTRRGALSRSCTTFEPCW